MMGSGCTNCPVRPCGTMNYRGSTCTAQRAKYGLGDPLTNAERIRAMNDDELAAFWASRYVEQNRLLLESYGIVLNATQLKVMSETLYRALWSWFQQSAEESYDGENHLSVRTP